MWEPVGPLPAAVYWRRRGVAAAALAIALALIVAWASAALAATPARSARITYTALPAQASTALARATVDGAPDPVDGSGAGDGVASPAPSNAAQVDNTAQVDDTAAAGEAGDPSTIDAAGGGAPAIGPGGGASTVAAGDRGPATAPIGYPVATVDGSGDPAASGGAVGGVAADSPASAGVAATDPAGGGTAAGADGRPTTGPAQPAGGAAESPPAPATSGATGASAVPATTGAAEQLRPDESPRPAPVATPVAVPASGPVPCTNAMLAVTAEVDQPVHKVGEYPVLRLVITDTSGQPCVRDLDPSRQEIVVWSGDGKTRLWSSNDCGNPGATDLRTLVTGQPVVFTVTWAGRTSAPGCAQPRTVVPAGNYRVMSRLDDAISSPTPFRLT